MNRQILIALGGAILVGIVLAAYELAVRGGESPDVTLAPGPTEVAPAASDESAPPASAAERAAARLPGPGDLRVEFDDDDGELTLLANNVPRDRILRALSRRVDFELDDYARHRRVTLAVVKQPVERVLGRLLHDTPYSLEYAANESGFAVLVHLTVGGAARPVVQAEGRDRDRDDDAEKERRRARNRAKEGGPGGDLYAENAYGEPGGEPAPNYVPATPEQRQRALAARAVRQQERRAEVLAEAIDPDPEKRLFAVETLDPDVPEDLALLRQAIETDPDPSVRAAAADQLGFGQRSAVGPVLQTALSDSDPEVVVKAIEGLSWVEDRSAQFRLKKLLDHYNEDVREAAAEALQDLKQ